MTVATTQEKPLVETVVSDHRSQWRKLPRRISVRALMILVLLLGGLLGWVVHLAHVQRDAIAAIRSGGGQVQYNWQLKTLPNGRVQFDPKGRPKAPTWLLDYLGHDYFGHVEHVELGPRNTDAVLKQVGQLNKLRQLRFFRGIDLTPLASAAIESLPNNGIARFQGLLGLFTTDLSPPPFNGASLQYLKNMTLLESLNLPDDSSVTDADLTYLSRLTALSMLQLHDPRITDAGLVSLTDMTRLKILMLSGTQVSGAGLRSLAAMTELKHLDLCRTSVDDLAPIGQLTLLSNLNLSQTPIDDKGLAPIVGLTELKDLGLNGTRITDAALARLTALPKLQTLSLDQTGVTDRGLATLIECKALRKLHVRGTKVSGDGLRAFQKARPGVGVMSD
jgi:hypothetical protein